MTARPAMVTQQTLRNLALGDKFFLRVVAVGPAGAGPPAVLDRPVHIQEAIGKAPHLGCCPQATYGRGGMGGHLLSPLTHTRAQPRAVTVVP